MENAGPGAREDHGAEPKAPPPKQPSPRDSNVAGSPKPLAPRLLEPRPGAVLDNGKADGRSALGGQFKKRPIPEEKSLAAVREKLEQEWPKAEKQPWQELATAAYAIRLGRDTKDKPAEQYALFEDAMERARRQGDCVLAILAAEELEKRFVTAEAEQNDKKRDLVKSAVAQARSMAAVGIVMEMACRQAGHARTDDDFAAWCEAIRKLADQTAKILQDHARNLDGQLRDVESQAQKWMAQAQQMKLEGQALKRDKTVRSQGEELERGAGKLEKQAQKAEERALALKEQAWRLKEQAVRRSGPAAQAACRFAQHRRALPGTGRRGKARPDR